MSVDNDGDAFEVRWKAFSEQSEGRPCSSDGLAADSPLYFQVGQHHEIKLITTDGLSVALARNYKELQNAALELEAQMAAHGDVTSGVVILSQELASQTFGSVSDDLIDKGISWQRSAHEDVISGAIDFINEYFQIRDLARFGLPVDAEA
jgi:hypothetical protein